MHWTNLLMDAYTAGVQTGPIQRNDVMGQAREHAILQHFEQRRLSKLYRTEQIMLASLAVGTDPKVYNHYCEEAFDTMEKLRSCLFSWLGKVTKKIAVGDWKEKMKRIVGVPSNKKTAVRKTKKDGKILKAWRSLVGK